MNQDKDKKNLMTVLKAIKTEQEQNPNKLFVRLPVNAKNGLTKIPYRDIEYILTELHHEQTIFLYEKPSYVEFYLSEGDGSTYKSFSLFVTNYRNYSNKLLPVAPEHLFSESYLKFLSPNNSLFHRNDLLNVLAVGKAGKTNRRILSKLLDATDQKLEISSLAMALEAGLRKNTFDKNKAERKKYTQKVINQCKTINSRISSYGFKIRFKQEYAILTHIEPKNP